MNDAIDVSVRAAGRRIAVFVGAWVLVAFAPVVAAGEVDAGPPAGRVSLLGETSGSTAVASDTRRRDDAWMKVLTRPGSGSYSAEAFTVRLDGASQSPAPSPRIDRGATAIAADARLGRSIAAAGVTPCLAPRNESPFSMQAGVDRRAPGDNSPLPFAREDAAFWAFVYATQKLSGGCE